ncbi:SAM-dependent methyltransferase [Thiorhodococcus minor]|uniref:Methyltransferase domain-containing protein n=1 Tax=Thiorhodococcus minor TaxID=57489 RepID=A0A6M0K4Y7_9GAMM|nr:methyltransferase domain-containing protein [Thiorhodococcus minor]NEV64822.1 methyltransferase domain-containing protein [Thiorhodococcus minor]
MSTQYSQVVETARTYYNSEDADNFYFHVWGGEDIHIGLYATPGEPIAEASRKTVERMASCVKGLGPDTRVLDLGSGYGGAARHLAKTYGCKVTALNLSERENDRNREMSREQGLGELIEVREGSFESVPAPDAAYDLVWSQDAILHSGERDQVISEAARVLRPGGELVCTDPMQADDCPEGVLQPVYDRIHLSSLGSIGFYREAAVRHGLQEVDVIEMTENLVVHYQRVYEELQRVRPELGGLVSDAYIERMLTGLTNWVEAGKKGYLSWGILHFRKPAS